MNTMYIDPMQPARSSYDKEGGFEAAMCEVVEVVDHLGRARSRLLQVLFHYHPTLGLNAEKALP